MRSGRHGRRVLVAGAALVVAGLLAYGISRLGLHRIGHALVSARPGWVAVALALMGSSLVMRAISWHQVLRAALPDERIAWLGVARATMIGVLASALFPGRLGEPSRVLVVARSLRGSTVRLVPVVAGTVFSQTLMNLLALAILAAVTFTSVPLLNGREGGLTAAIVVPLLIAALVVTGPSLLRRAQRTRLRRVRTAALAVGRMLRSGRRGLIVFARLRLGVVATASQLVAWALQWMACYAVVRALGLEAQAGLVAAAAVLLAVNVSAILPATPSNVGVFQAACLVVLAAYGVGGGQALAYGIILQAVEVATAVALGVPALLGEGMSWSDIRISAETERAEEAAAEAESRDPAEPAEEAQRTGGPGRTGQ